MIAVFYEDKFKYLCANKKEDSVKIDFSLFGMNRDLVRVFEFKKEDAFYFKKLFNTNKLEGSIVGNTCTIKEVISFRKGYKYTVTIKPCSTCEQEFNPLDYYTQDELDLYASELQAFQDWIATEPQDETDKPDQTSPYWDVDNLKSETVVVDDEIVYGDQITGNEFFI